MRKSKSEYPFVVTTIIPKGSAIGSKKRDTIRYEFYKTMEQAQKDVDAWQRAGLISKAEKR